MKDIEKMKEELSQMFEVAFASRLCNSQKTFANFVGVNESSMSSALKGNEAYVTEGLLRKCRLALIDAGVYSPKVAAENNAIQQNTCTGGKQQNTLNAEGDVRYIVDRLTEEMKAQRESYERILLAALQK